MFENQKQETGDSAVSLQAGRDLIINGGVSFSEIKEIFHLLLKENFPILREIAAQTASQNIENFLAKFETKFMRNLDRIDMEKLKDPDVQFSLNEAVGASARKGSKIDSDILSELIIKRIEKDTPDLISMVSSEAIRILPKLTPEHINFLSLVHYLWLVSYDFNDLTQFEYPASRVVSLTKDSFNLSLSNKRYLEFTGSLSYLRITATDFMDITKQKYEFLKNIPNDQLEKQIAEKAPSYKRLIEVYNSSEIYKTTLTTVGQMIAIANLKRIFDNFDYEIWIN